MKVSIGLARHLVQNVSCMNAWYNLSLIRAVDNCKTRFTIDRLANLSLSPYVIKRTIEVALREKWLRTDGKGNYFPQGNDKVFQLYCSTGSCVCFEVTSESLIGFRRQICGMLMIALGNALRAKTKEQGLPRVKGAGSADDVQISLTCVATFFGVSFKNAYQMRKKASESGHVKFTREYSKTCIAMSYKEFLAYKAELGSEQPSLVYKAGFLCTECASRCHVEPMAIPKSRRKLQS